MKALYSFETSLTINQQPQSNIHEDLNLQLLKRWHTIMCFDPTQVNSINARYDFQLVYFYYKTHGIMLDTSFL